MRISDWSSDVCSSDLPAGRSDRLRPFAFEPGGPEFASPEYATRMRKASPPVARALRLADGSHFALQYHGPGIKRPPEIGRAHVCTPVTNAHLLCRHLLDHTKHTHFYNTLPCKS